MKTRISLFLAVLAVLVFNACGTTKPLPVADDSPKVQVTFFGACFGDGPEYSVTNTMTRNGIGRDWHTVNRETRIIQNVPFAGKEWYAALVYFSDHQFCRIIFADKFESEEDALRELNEMRKLLSKKYNLTALSEYTSEEELKNVYSFMDSVGNSVSVAVLKMDELGSEPWTCSITYSWYKAQELKEAKALNEI